MNDSEMRDHRVAVIGLGRMGRRHVQAVQGLGLEIAGVADPSPDALRAVGEESGVEPDRRFADAAAMLRERRPACVVVATTAPTHCEYTRLAAEAGARYILCEKPMARSLAECRRMVEVCESTGARLAINHQMRFMPAYTEAKRVVDSEAFGGLGSITVIGGNGGLAMLGTHYFELLRYITGEPAARVSAWLDPDRIPNPRGAEFGDRAGSLRADTSGGRRLYLDMSADQGHGLTIVYSGGCGQLIVDVLSGRLSLTVRRPEHRPEATTRYNLPATTEQWEVAPVDVVAPTQALIRALFAGEDYPTGEDGLAAVAGIVAAHVSDEAGHRPVRVGDDLPAERIFSWA